MYVAYITLCGVAIIITQCETKVCSFLFPAAFCRKGRRSELLTGVPSKIPYFTKSTHRALFIDKKIESPCCHPRIRRKMVYATSSNSVSVNFFWRSSSLPVSATLKIEKTEEQAKTTS